MNLQRHIARRLADAIDAALPAAAGTDPLVAAAHSERFGHYQANFAMALAKRLKAKPRDVAQAVVTTLDRGDFLETPEVAGPGFINLRVTAAWLRDAVQAMANDPDLGVEKAADPRTVIVDFSAPNTCKPMHVGHIRSMVIGDAICRLLRRLGHTVIADNHLGDWGTQFGLLIMGFRRFADEVPDTGDPLERLVEIYQKANAAADADETLRDEARAELAKLQAGDPDNLAKWQTYSRWSWEHFQRVYDRLDIHFDEVLGESRYNDMLPGVIDDLVAKGIAEESDGALCVFWDDDALPALVVRKRDGAFLYATTDLATLKYREDRWAPDQIVYVTDARQQLHFRQIFSVAQRWGIARNTDLRHVWFGTILGPDGRPFKTRSGDLVPLEELLDEAERRAMDVVSRKNSDLAADEMARVARVVGLGAVKYADLSQNRQSDVLFNWDAMLAMQGNTAPYLQYAYARIRSIFRKDDQADEPDQVDAPIALDEPAERSLALKLLQFPETLAGAADDFRLNLVAAYLFELSAVFTTFYESCPVLKSDPPTRASRLRLCDLTARVLETGLDLLGIQVVQRM